MRNSMSFATIEQSITEIASHQKALERIVEEVQSNYTSLSTQNWVAGTRNKLLTVINEAKNNNVSLTQLLNALETSKREFHSCEIRLSGKGSSSVDIATEMGMYSSRVAYEDSLEIGAGSVTTEELRDTVASNGDGYTLAALLTTTGFGLDYLKEFGSNLGDFKDLFGLWGVLADSENALKVYEGIKEVKDATIFKVSGYINDGRDLVNALESGDADKLEGLIDKYGKKALKAASGASGPTSGIYIDLGYTAIKNFSDSTQAFVKDPSFNTFMAGVWNTTGMAFIDTGVGLAEDTLDFVYKLFGKEFDKVDFHNAMDFLGNTVVDTAKNIGEDIGSFIGETIINTEKVISAGKKAIKKAGETVAKWIGWL